MQRALDTIRSMEGDTKDKITAQIAISLKVSERKAKEYVRLYVKVGTVIEDGLQLYTKAAWENIEERRRIQANLAEDERVKGATLEAFMTEDVK